jgi:Tfp pilus assembly protein PilX
MNHPETNRFQRDAVGFAKTEHKPGFALVVVLSLMILLTIIAVGLLGLSAIELRSSSAGQNQASARANARLAMMLALGELQKTAGPDQRVTAAADLLDTTHASKAKWTGAWNPAKTPADPPVWLVSGQNPSNSGAAAALGDQIGSGVSLVGSNSSDVTGAVSAVRVAVSPTATSKGSYAYWVGDEGVKAKVNMTDPYYAYSSTSNVAEARKRAQYPPRANLKAISEFSAFSINNAINDSLSKAVSLNQLDLLSPSLAGTPRKSAFHDVTTASYGVLSNIRDGGLKRDLSRVLYDSTPETGPVFTYPDGARGISWEMLRSYAQTIATGTGGSGIPEVVVRPHRVGQIPKASGAYSANPFGSTDQHGFAPIITRFSWELFPGLEAAGASPTDPSDPLYKLQVSLRVRFVLANPYNVRLVAPADYRVSFNYSRDQFTGVDWRIGPQNSPLVQYRLPWEQLCSNFSAAERTSALNTPNPWWHFIVPAFTLEPGEAVIFSADDSAPGYPVLQPITRMKRGDFPSARLRFQIGASPGGNPVVSKSQLTAAASNYAIGDAGHVDVLSAAFAKGGGRNSTISLHFDDGSSAAQLANNLGEPLTRLERASHTIFKRNFGYNWLSLATGGIAQDPFTGGDISLVNHSQTTGGTNNGYSDNNRINFARNANLRFPFPPDTAGRPFPENDARRQLFPYRNGWVDQARVTYSSIGTNALWGPNDTPTNQSNSGRGQLNVTLYEVLTQPLVSLGQLQHANWFGQDRPVRPDNAAYQRASVTTPANDGSGVKMPITRSYHAGMAQPNYGVGNAYRDPAAGKADIDPDDSKTFDGLARANRAMWDKYFVSTIPKAADFPTADPARLLNRRMIFQAPDGGQPKREDLLDVEKAAANLMVDGAFNINSTSVNAWEAMLSSLNGNSYVIAPPGGPVSVESNVQNPFSRVSQPNAVTGGTPSSADKRWQSAIKLTDEQIHDLASGIVQRIKKRAKDSGNKPFTSLEQFINRQPSSTVETLGLIQETLEQTQLPDGTALTGGGLNGNFAIAYAFGKHGTGSLSQGDVLQALGPFISARSDTFVIRTCGEARSPDGKTVTARAWCEAVVQRIPAFVDPANDATAAPATLKPVNQAFGRRFIVRSFRWLPSNEI